MGERWSGSGWRRQPGARQRRTPITVLAVVVLALAVLAGGVVGCSDGSTLEQDRETELAAAQARAEEAERKVADQQAQLEALEQQVAELERRLLEEGGEPPVGSGQQDAAGEADTADEPDGAGEGGLAGEDGAAGEADGATSHLRLTGNLDELAAAEPGQLQVVAIGPPGRSGRVSWIVHNATNRVVFDLNVVVTARDAQGTLLDSGGTLAVAPFAVPPDGRAIGYSFLGGDQLPEDVELEAEVSADDDPLILEVDVPVTELSVREDGVTGIVHNDSGRALRFVSVVLVCIDEQGVPTHTVSEFTDRSDLPAGASSPFSGRLFDVDCSGYLAGASGRE